ncbi:hypothetical protein HOO65_040050 [Ceratocystis lukuohia]|uniref:Retroviral polymerase SH3-like domain-containing protein n=1 Tax=Ceratocystis lukuohia TaxID=2019550 RepID=A0ABR4MHF8_9PEZI
MISPYEAVFRIQPFVGHLVAFGAAAYVYIPEEQRVMSQKMPARIKNGIFVGYQGDTIYWIYLPEENEVISSRSFIIDLDSRGFPPRLRGVEEMANKLLADRDASSVGKRWASNFVKRQPDLKTRFNRRYDYQRAKCEDPAIIRDWFGLVEDTIAKYGITLVDIYNFNEAGFMMGLIASGMVVTGTERRGQAKSAHPGNREWVTAIQAINAEDWAIAPFIVAAG